MRAKAQIYVGLRGRAREEQCRTLEVNAAGIHLGRMSFWFMIRVPATGILVVLVRLLRLWWWKSDDCGVTHLTSLYVDGINSVLHRAFGRRYLISTVHLDGNRHSYLRNQEHGIRTEIDNG